jgi:hypothetical protein
MSDADNVGGLPQPERVRRDPGAGRGRLWPVLKRQVGQAIEHWHKPDQGIWEVRGPARHFLINAVMHVIRAEDPRASLRFVSPRQRLP